MPDNKLKLFYKEPNVEFVFEQLQTSAPLWLRIQGLEDYGEFYDWIKTTHTTILSIPWGYVFVNEYVEGVRITLHPCFTNKQAIHQVVALNQIVSDIRSAYHVHRVQVFVSEIAGHTIRKLLKSLHFRQEALLQKYTINRLTTPIQLISSEVWSIIK